MYVLLVVYIALSWQGRSQRPFHAEAHKNEKEEEISALVALLSDRE